MLQQLITELFWETELVSNNQRTNELQLDFEEILFTLFK